ncbi:pachytene checkpoint protein 2 homolog isoform X2 [Nycticebus coucang]|uniref:pachytene checkpoint protein 2 homolog isoform X2 n=1 Tax=Nycticebus coucang TaxID=9470 RepID=UPI00234D4AA2|nr:pachytene checkpoint protein 2 homolog isoform X2 [Nycticebus coucang]
MDEAVGDLKQALPCVADGPTVHVEVLQRGGSTAKKEDIKLNVKKLLNRHNIVFGDYTWTEFDEPFLTRNVQSVSVVDTELKVKDPQPIDLSVCTVALHVFQLNEDGPSSENLEEETENIIAANHWVLPAAEFHGLWDSLVYDVHVKSHLLDYVMTTLLFTDRNVNSNLITWNRVVLLHGPPGTGKTSLCKALAQKLTIRLSSRYRYGQLIEINSHSLFSKWFSEVESLTAARSACRAGAEPSDAIRVVNAVLTQIDQIKRHSNVVILTTSNITEKIDVAFVDRADIKQYIGPPSMAAIFKIYLSCLEELMKCQIIYPRQQLLTLRELEMIGFIENNVSKLSLLLSEISRKSEGLSGRVLRKLPFLAHALYVQAPTVTIEGFLQALSLAVDKQFEEREKLTAYI